MELIRIGFRFCLWQWKSLMKCPSCKSKIGTIKCSKFIIGLALRKAMPCPYCDTNIYRLTNPTWEYFKLIIFVIFWFGIFLFLLAIIFGKQTGYESALIVSFWFWIIVIIVISSIILCNLAIIFIYRIYIKIRAKRL
jgi:hypothetical protein